MTPEQLEIMAKCSDGNSSPDLLELYAHAHPRLVLANPALPLIELENKEKHDTIVALALEGLAIKHSAEYLDRALSKGSSSYPWHSFAWLSHALIVKAAAILPEDKAASVIANMAKSARGHVTSSRNSDDRIAREAVAKMLSEFAVWIVVDPLEIEARKLLFLCYATGQTPPEEIRQYSGSWTEKAAWYEIGSDEPESDD